MNAERLLAHYERIADTPDAVARLRKFILDLAVRGKLVPQNLKDEPAEELLKKIAAEKARLIKAGKIRKERSTAPIRNEELPIVLPPKWEWLRLHDIGFLAGGMTPSMSREDYWGGEVVWLSPKDIKSDEVSSSELKITTKGLSETKLERYRPGSLFMVARSGILKRTFPVAINRAPAAANQDMKVLVPFLDGQERYLQIMFRGLSDFILKELVKTGTTVQSLKYAEFEEQPFPIPPLAEQQRIVAKTDELMALCDRIETSRAEREARRDRLATASLARLNAPNSEASIFAKDARFALNKLSAIAARPDQIKQIRQTVLNLAVRGRLVAQDPKDEPVGKLLCDLSLAKEELVKVGTVPQPKKATRDPSRLTSDLPDTWVAVALGDICSLVTSGSRGWGEFYAASGPGFIRAQNIRFGKLIIDDLARVNPPTKSEGNRTLVAKGDLLVVITGAGVTNPAILDRDLGETYVSQHVALVRPTDARFSRWFLLCLMAPSGGREELIESAYGAGKPGLNLDNIRSLSIPLAPLPEQARILAKVDELMALCDRLEGRLIAGADTRCELLVALLAEALMSRAEREKAA